MLLVKYWEFSETFEIKKVPSVYNYLLKNSKQKLFDGLKYSKMYQNVYTL